MLSVEIDRPAGATRRMGCVDEAGITLRAGALLASEERAGGATVREADVVDRDRRCWRMATELLDGAVDTVSPLRALLSMGRDRTCSDRESRLDFSKAYPCCNRFRAFAIRSSGVTHKHTTDRQHVPQGSEPAIQRLAG